MKHRLHKYAVIALAGLLILITLIFSSRSRAPEKTAAIITGGDTTEPAAAIILPQAGTMYLLNAPRTAINPLIDTAAHYGVNHISRLDFGRPTSDSANGTGQLLKNFPAEKFRMPAGPIRSRTFQKIAQALRPETGAQQDCLITPANDRIKWQKLANGELLVQFNSREVRIPRTSRERVYIIEER